MTTYLVKCALPEAALATASLVNVLELWLVVGQWYLFSCILSWLKCIVLFISSDSLADWFEIPLSFCSSVFRVCVTLFVVVGRIIVVWSFGVTLAEVWDRVVVGRVSGRVVRISSSVCLTMVVCLWWGCCFC